jgi:plasmid stabilization system protein ParE
MDYQVVLSASARRDIRDVVRYISADVPERALEFGRFLVSKTRILSQFPELGREVPEVGDPAVREIIVRSYRVIYRVRHRERKVEVIRFWHGARGGPKEIAEKP